MPTYEYECPRCGHRFEKVQGMNDPPVKRCPRCRGRKVRRLIGTGVGILFRGSGFYQTDYRSESYTAAAKKEAESSSGDKTGEKSGEKAADAKKTDEKPKAKGKKDTKDGKSRSASK